MAEINCPKCDTKFIVQGVLLGKDLRCSNCGLMFVPTVDQNFESAEFENGDAKSSPDLLNRKGPPPLPKKTKMNLQLSQNAIALIATAVFAFVAFLVIVSVAFAFYVLPSMR